MYAASEAERVFAAAGLIPGLTSDQVCKRLEAGVASEESNKRLVAFYLVEMQEHQLYLDEGFSDTEFYAQERLGLDPRRTRERIALGRKLLQLPAIDVAFCEGRLGWSKLLLLARAATPEHEEEWLALALDVDCTELALQVKLAKEGQGPRKPGDRKGTREIRFTHSARVDSLTHQMIEKAKAKLTDERGEPVGERDFLRIAADIVLSSEEDGSVRGRTRVPGARYRIVLRPGEDGTLWMDTAEGKIPVDDACIRCDAEIEVVEDEYPESRRRVPRPGASPKTELAPKTSAALREKILTRDGHRCRCCGRRRMLSVHHIVFRSKGGETRGANEITLCDRCHALIHDELLFIEGPDARHACFVDQKGRRLRESCGTVEAREEAKLACAMTRQPGASPTQALTSAQAGRKTVTLASLPATVDGAWWRRHADLVEFKKGKGLLFRPGAPLPEEEAAGDSQEEAKEEHKAFEGLVGQDVRVEHFRTLAKGSRELGEPFPHTLFLGPPGTGKTTLARQVAALVGGRLHATSGPLLEDTHALLRVLAGLEAGDVLFLDEVHAVPQPVLEVLYEAMTDRRLSLTLYEGSRTRTLRLELPPVTLLAATTEGGALPDALKSRFLLRESLGPYGLDDLAALLQDRAQARGLDLQELVARTLAWFARGTPREGLRLLECVGRSAAGRGETSVDLAAMDATLREMGFDFQGLRPDEQRYLEVLEDSDQPIPLHQLARELGVSPTEVLQDIEPLLFRRGLVRMTPRGRAPVGYAPLALARES